MSVAYSKNVPFPQAFIPKGMGTPIIDPFANLLRSAEDQLPTMPVVAGGGGTPGTTTVISNVHPFMIVIDNNYDASDPPEFVDATATVYSGVVYQGLGSFTSTHTITGIGSTFTPVSGQFLYLAGTTSASAGTVTVTGITLTQASSLPARTTFSSGLQTAFTYPIGKYLANVDGSFYAEQWCHGNLTMLDVCISNQGAKYPFQV